MSKTLVRNSIIALNPTATDAWLRWQTEHYDIVSIGGGRCDHGCHYTQYIKGFPKGE